MRLPLSRYNILVVTNGLDRPEHALLYGLSKASINIDVICNPNYDRQTELEKAGMRLYPYHIRHRLDIKAVQFIRKRLKSQNYRIIYAMRNNALSTSLFAGMRTKAKIVGYRGTTGHLGAFNPESWITYLNPRVDKIVCVSNAVKQYLAFKNVPPSKLATIYKGHDISWYQETENKRPLTDLPIPKDSFVVGFVGNIRPVKGVGTLIQALQYIPETKNIYFVVIGDIRDTKIKKMSTDPTITKRVYFSGYKKNAARLMKYFNIFVMPSVAREGLPRALMEAMAQQVPPIVSSVGGMPEIVTAYKDGFIVPPRNAAKLADAILFLFKNQALCKKLGENARDRIKNDFNIQDTIQQTIALFDQLASKSQNYRSLTHN